MPRLQEKRAPSRWHIQLGDDISDSLIPKNDLLHRAVLAEFSRHRDCIGAYNAGFIEIVLGCNHRAIWLIDIGVHTTAMHQFEEADDATG